MRGDGIPLRLIEHPKGLVRALFSCSTVKTCAGAILVLVGVLGCALPRVAEEDDPRSYVFPLARSGQTINHTFYIVNDSEKEKRVENVKSSCGCTVTQVSKGDAIAPGTKLPVPIEINLAGKEGEVSSTVEIQLSGQDAPVLLTLSGIVHVDCPAAVDFETVKRGDANTKSFKIRGFSGQPNLQISRLEFKEDWFDVYAKPSDRNSFDVTVSLKRNIPYGVFEAPIIIHTNDGEVPVKKTSVKGRILGRLEVSEKSVYFGALKAGETLTKSVNLSAPYGEGVTFVGVDNSRQEIFATQLASALEPKSDILPVTITTTGAIPEGTATGIVKGTLLFHTRVGESEETARVEVYGLIE